MSSRWPITRLQNYAVRFTRGVNHPAAIVGLLLLDLLVSESLLFVGSDQYAVLIYLVVLVISTLGLSWVEEAAPALGGVALVAVFRLVFLSMPRFFDSPLLGTAVVYGAVLPGAYLLARIRQPTMASTAQSRLRVLAWFLLGILASLLLAEFAFRVFRPEALVSSRATADLAVIGAAMLVVAATEELVFRRILQQGLESYFGAGGGILLASAVYGAMYGGHGDPRAIGVGALIGLVFGLLYNRTGSLGLVIGLHTLFNVLLFAVLPHGGSVLPV